MTSKNDPPRDAANVNQPPQPPEELSPGTQRSAAANQAAAEQTTGPDDPANQNDENR